MPFTSESLCHEIRKHVVCGAILDINRALFDVVPDEMELNIHMLCLCVMQGVLGQVNGALIVAEKDGRLVL